VTKQVLPDLREINFAYDHNGNLTSITPPGRPQHLFTYTPVDLTQSYTPPAAVPGGATSYSYNRDRQLTLITRPDARTVSLGYDAAGRLGTLTIARGSYTFAYDPTSGNLSSINAPDGGQLLYNYDGSLLTQMAWNGAVQGNISWGYDNDLAVTFENVCDPFGKCMPVGYDYDNDKLLFDAAVDLGFGTSFVLQLNRDPGNGLVTATTAGPITDAWTYNGFGEPASYQAQVGTTPLFAQSYTRDGGGRITTKSETISGVSSTFTYGYDTAGRLTTVTKDGNPLSSYTYDSNSNRLTKNAEVGTYDAQDRLITYNGATYTYTANGELQTKVDSTERQRIATTSSEIFSASPNPTAR
jgi:YD repeat-containing protein